MLVWEHMKNGLTSYAKKLMGLTEKWRAVAWKYQTWVDGWCEGSLEWQIKERV